MTSRLAIVFLLASCTWGGCKDIEANPIVGRAYAPTSVVDPPGPPPNICPSRRPYDGLTCSSGLSSKVVCEYGSNVDPACNTRVECDSTWKTRHEPPTCSPCVAEDQVREGAPCGVVVAADADAGDSGAGADAGSLVNEQLCAYPSRTCACSRGDGTLSPRWACTETPKDCPAARPLEGQPCTVQQTCNYGACVLTYGLAMRCANAVWTIADIACP